jgi:outer membrane protein assembly factor BamB
MKPLSTLALIAMLAASLSADEWPQWRGPNRDGVWKESGIIQSFPSKKIAHKWSVPIGGGYSGPTVADGRVYVTDRIEEPQMERVHCVDFKTGKPLWRHDYPVDYSKVSYPAGPRAAVTIDEGRAYSLGSKGHLHCLDAKTGQVIWSHDCFTEYKIRLPIWGIASSPLIDGDLLIAMIGGEQACIVAFNKHTGAEVWTALEDRANYSAPMVIQQAAEKVVVFWTGDNLVGLAPQSGTVRWTHPFKPQRMPLGVGTPILHRGHLFVSGFYDGSQLLKVNPDRFEVAPVWQRRGRSERSTDALHSIISTPILIDDHVYGVDSYGEFRCLELTTGDRIWEDRTATPQERWSTIHFVKNGDRTWMFNEAGELIIAQLSPKGFEEISRAKLIDPTPKQLRQRLVVWAHPAFAYRHVFARNDQELICASLSAE